MTTPDARAWLRSALDDLAQAREHLAFSSARVAGIDFARETPTPEELERIEAYTSRFARGGGFTGEQGAACTGPL
jgi:hypothetical protein